MILDECEYPDVTRNVRVAAPIIDVLQQRSGVFRDSVVESIKHGRTVTPRAQEIITEIMAKQYGNKNSVGYKAHYPEQKALVTEILEVLLWVTNTAS